MTNFILAITGSTGSGKSTVAHKLAKEFDKCVNIDADHVKDMVVSGFSYELNPDGSKEWDFNQWELVGESIGNLAENFRSKGYGIIINGYLPKEAWEEIEKKVELTHKILLNPHMIENFVRDTKRDEEFRMGQKAVETHSAYFATTDYFKDFMKLDTSDQSVEESVKAVLELLK